MTQVHGAAPTLENEALSPVNEEPLMFVAAFAAGLVACRKSLGPSAERSFRVMRFDTRKPVMERSV
jgi:hypothetical protein